MPSLNFRIKYKRNTGLVLSTKEFKDLYFYGVTVNAKDGTDYPDSTIEFYIRSAQSEIEKYISVRVFKQLVNQSQHYRRYEYVNDFPIIQLTWNINKPLTLIGLLNKIEQIIYPKEWLVTYESNQGEVTRTLNVVPNGVTTVSGNQDVILLGTTANLGIQRFKNIPNYWSIQYETGFELDNIPFELINIIGKTASLGPFATAGDLIIGAGIASHSLGIDGLNQSIASTSSATNSGYGARVFQYSKEIKQTMDRLKNQYKSIMCTYL